MLKKITIILISVLLFSINLLFAQALGPQPNANHTVGLNSDGTVYIWGNNEYAQLGDNSTTQRDIPVKVLKGEYNGTTYLGDDPSNKISAVSLGNYHSIALAENGHVYAWGYNGYGQLGDNTIIQKDTPVKVLKGAYNGTSYLGDDPSNKIKTLALGYFCSIALDENGLVYTWGYNTYGQLGDSTMTYRTTPVNVLKGAYDGTLYLGDNPGNKIVDIALGLYHSIALAEDGTVYTWGYNANGQLGDSTTTQSIIPVKVQKGAYNGTTYLGDDPSNKIISVALGMYHSIALAEDGTVYTWGSNSNGKLGDNTITQRITPVKVLKGTYNGTTYLGDDPENKIRAVALGKDNSMALAADGMVYSWGGNGYGQLGDNTTTLKRTPIKVLKGAYSGTTYLGDNPDNKISAVTVGYYHSVALTSDGSVFTWGNNEYGQLGDNSTTISYVPLKVSGVGGIGELALPVTLVLFSASTDKGNVALTWQTGSETENSGYLLERRELGDVCWSRIASYLDDNALVGQGSSSESHTYHYDDNKVPAGGCYEYRLADVDYSSNIIWHDAIVIDVPLEDDNIPAAFGLQKAYPNPFNPSITLSYGLTVGAHTSLKVYNVRGDLVQTLHNAYQLAGTYQLAWQPDNIAAGVYFIQLHSGNNTNLQKVLFVK